MDSDFLIRILFLGIIAGSAAYFSGYIPHQIWTTLGYTDKSYTLFVAPITEEIFKIGFVLLLNSILLIIIKKKREGKTNFSEEKNLILFSALTFGILEGIGYTILENQGIFEFIIRLIGHPVISSSYILLRIRMHGKKSYFLSFIPAIILHLMFNHFSELERILKVNSDLTTVLLFLVLIFLSIFEYHLFKKFTV